MTDRVDPMLPVGTPASLAQRAPARIEFTDTAGQALRLTPRGLRVRAGQEFVVRVVLRANSADPPIDVHFTALDDGLRKAGEACRYTSGANQAWSARYHAVLINNLLPEKVRRILPVPGYGRLTVAVADGRSEAVPIRFRVEIWPSRYVFLGCGATAVFSFFLAPLLAGLYRQTGDPAATAGELLAQPWTVVGSFVGTLGSAVALYAVNHLVAMTGWLTPSDGD